MPISKLTPEGTYPYLDERVRALANAVPEAVADGRINWQKLREALGGALEEEEAGSEHFGLSWPGKREARALAAKPSRGTLVPALGEGVNEDSTENLFIEGDNLEVMKLLLKSYAGRVKMIYIDPPYNTGNDFIYNDNFSDPLEAYLDYTGARGESGELLTTNTRADGRFHSKWLSMMYPRLLLAHKLLREDGVIFVSIDDNEVHHLRQMMNEVFGEENFLESIIRKTRSGGGAMSKYIATNHDYVLTFAKVKHQLDDLFVPYDEDYLKRYKEEDENGKYFWDTFIRRRKGNKNVYEIKSPDGTILKDQWNLTEEKFKLMLIEDEIRFLKNEDGWSVQFKQRLSEQGRKFPSIYNSATNDFGTSEILKLFNNRIFDYPKPTQLINQLLSLVSAKESIILDFFAGSGSTADSVLRMNTTNGNNNRFILVQLPELVEQESAAFQEDYETISEIGKERIRRVITSIQANPSIDETVKQNADLGFRVFKLAHSHYRQWQDAQEPDTKKLNALFESVVEPLIEGWQPENLLSEILLLEGFPLTSQVAFLDEITSNQVYRVTAQGFCQHALLICFDERIADATIRQLSLDGKDVLICLDSALTDETKARLQDRFNLRVI